jgi:hypothetical protein
LPNTLRLAKPALTDANKTALSESLKKRIPLKIIKENHFSRPEPVQQYFGEWLTGFFTGHWLLVTGYWPLEQNPTSEDSIQNLATRQNCSTYLS